MSSANTPTLYTGNCFAYLVRPSRLVSSMVISSSSCIGVFQIRFSRASISLYRSDPIYIPFGP
nr:MAG TPA: hypothetical protein [Herelleviridae sp.]